MIDVVEMDEIRTNFAKHPIHRAHCLTIPEECRGFLDVLTDPIALRIIKSVDEISFIRRLNICWRPCRKDVHLVPTFRLMPHQLIQINIDAIATIKKFIDVENFHECAA